MLLFIIEENSQMKLKHCENSRETPKIIILHNFLALLYKSLCVDLYIYLLFI